MSSDGDAAAAAAAPSGSQPLTAAAPSGSLLQQHEEYTASISAKRRSCTAEEVLQSPPASPAAKIATDLSRDEIATESLTSLFQNMAGEQGRYVVLTNFWEPQWRVELQRQANAGELKIDQVLYLQTVQDDLRRLANALPPSQKYHIPVAQLLDWAAHFFIAEETSEITSDSEAELPEENFTKVLCFTNFMGQMTPQLSDETFAHWIPPREDDQIDFESICEKLRAPIVPEMVRLGCASELELEQARLDLQRSILCSLCGNALRKSSVRRVELTAEVYEESEEPFTTASVAHGVCGHAHHQDCIEKWLLTNSTCPFQTCGEEDACIANGFVETTIWETAACKPVDLMQAIFDSSSKVAGLGGWDPAIDGW